MSSAINVNKVEPTFNSTLLLNILLDLENDVAILNQINTKEFMVDTAHQRGDLVHRFEYFL